MLGCEEVISEAWEVEGAGMSVGRCLSLQKPKLFAGAQKTYSFH